MIETKVDGALFPATFTEKRAMIKRDPVQPLAATGKLTLCPVGRLFREFALTLDDCHNHIRAIFACADAEAGLEIHSPDRAIATRMVLPRGRAVSERLGGPYQIT